MKRWIFAGGVIIFVFIAGTLLLTRSGGALGLPATAHDSEASATSTISVGNLSFTPELALSPAAREQGLSGRASVPDDYGMLFVFPDAEPYGFWMKDMLVPLDMLWLDAKGQVVSLQVNVATDTYPTVLYPTAPALYVLETRAGFAAEHGIATGTVLDLKNLPSVLK